MIMWLHPRKLAVICMQLQLQPRLLSRGLCRVAYGTTLVIFRSLSSPGRHTQVQLTRSHHHVRRYMLSYLRNRNTTMLVKRATNHMLRHMYPEWRIQETPAHALPMIRTANEVVFDIDGKFSQVLLAYFVFCYCSFELTFLFSVVCLCWTVRPV